ncbi:hypothetical protein PN836_017555 [Ningiella sp. W23]|uniref:hypothetical protein n=1 Tax=Ningiella sp. W23 TaxID=3023715 RepID=UPI0037580566
MNTEYIEQEVNTATGFLADGGQYIELLKREIKSADITALEYERLSLLLGLVQNNANAASSALDRLLESEGMS